MCFTSSSFKKVATRKEEKRINDEKCHSPKSECTRHALVSNVVKGMAELFYFFSSRLNISPFNQYQNLSLHFFQEVFQTSITVPPLSSKGNGRFKNQFLKFEMKN